MLKPWHCMDLGEKSRDNIVLPSLQCKGNVKYANNEVEEDFFIPRSSVCPHLTAAFCNVPPFQHLLKYTGNQQLPEDDVGGGLCWAKAMP